MKINVVSWNIRRGEEYSEVIKTLKKHEADIVGLQEVDKNTERTGARDLPRLIARGLGFDYVFGRSVNLDKNGWMGNCILSRLPIKNSRIHKLNPDLVYKGGGETEPRVLVEAEIKAEEKNLTFFTTHLAVSKGLKTNGIRLGQVKDLLMRVKKTDPPLVLTGDFNSPASNPETRRIEGLLKRCGSDKDYKTWPRYGIERKGWKVSPLEYGIDHIFVSSDIECSRFRVLSTTASDHLPLIARINIG